MIIEDEFELLKSIEASLKSENYIVEKATDYESGIEKIMMYQYDCILLDIGILGGSGLKILEKMKESNITGNTIIISAKDLFG